MPRLRPHAMGAATAPVSSSPPSFATIPPRPCPSLTPALPTASSPTLRRFAPSSSSPSRHPSPPPSPSIPDRPYRWTSPRSPHGVPTRAPLPTQPPHPHPIWHTHGILHTTSPPHHLHQQRHCRHRPGAVAPRLPYGMVRRRPIPHRQTDFRTRSRVVSFRLTRKNYDRLTLSAAVLAIRLTSKD